MSGIVGCSSVLHAFDALVGVQEVARAHRDLRTDRFACDDQYFLKTVVISGISMMFLSSVEVKLSRHIV